MTRGGLLQGLLAGNSWSARAARLENHADSLAFLNKSPLSNSLCSLSSPRHCDEAQDKHQAVSRNLTNRWMPVFTGQRGSWSREL
jgi:hypothetical protein